MHRGSLNFEVMLTGLRRIRGTEYVVTEEVEASSTVYRIVYIFKCTSQPVCRALPHSAAPQLFQK